MCMCEFVRQDVGHVADAGSHFLMSCSFLYSTVCTSWFRLEEAKEFD